MSAPRVITVRASSWSGLFDCAYSWEGAHLLGMRKASGLRAQLGTAVHASTATYDSGRLPGGRRATVDDAAGVFVATLRNPDRDVDYSQDKLTVREAERIGLTLHTRYCLEISPKFNFLSVEATLAPLEIDCGDGIVIRLTGSMDRARVAETGSGRAVVPDIKTGSRVIGDDGQAITKGRAPQLGTYQLMLENDPTQGVPTDGAQVIALSTTSKPAAAVSKVFDAKRVMLGTDEAPGLIQHAATMFKTGLFPPNPQSVLCSERYCARYSRCIYRG